MITVKELLNQPMFAEFKVLTHEKTLNNVVMGTGIYDWETPEAIMNTFEAGEFVLTKLDKMYQDRDAYVKCISLLIEMKMSAISFKTENNDAIPKELILQANLKNVALLSFSKTYYDDIIYYVKNIIMSESNNEVLLELVHKLEKARNQERAISLVQKINPLFRKVCRCISIYSENNLNKEYESIYQRVNQKGYCTVIKGNRSILMIATFHADRIEDMAEDEIEKHIQMQIPDLQAGISRTYQTTELRTAIMESRVALYTAMMEDKAFCSYDKCGITKLIVPAFDSPWIDSFYEEFHRNLTEYDKKHGGYMNHTLITYVESNYDVVKTAEKLYQHANTIRYRLGRIQELLGFDSEMEFIIQSAVYVKICRLKEVVGEEAML